MPLSLSSRNCGNVHIIQCKGRIAVGDEVKSLDAALQTGTRQYTKLVLNIGDVERLDSTGIGLLVRHASNIQKRGGDMRLAAAPEFIIHLLNLANLSSYLQVHATEEDAILSFLKQRVTLQPQEKRGPRVLLFDHSADLCAFVRTVLVHHGFDVRSTSNFGDAKILLRVDEAEYLLVGPGTPQLSPETALSSLVRLAPKATALRLDADFTTQDAHVATESLLKLFGIQTPA